MNKTFTFLILLFSLSLSAQSISGKAIYHSNTKTDRDYSEMPEEKRLRLRQREKDLYEKTYILTFNNSESLYKEEETLDSGNNMYRAGYLAAMGSYSSLGIYKDTKHHKFMEQREFLGKLFLVKDSLPEFKWELENESKKIGDYTVFKATAIQKMNFNDYRMIDAPSTEKTIIVTAWYTPQIPINAGPDIYSGLPGLILELNVYGTTFLCSKIILNPKYSEEIKQPKNGQIISIDEFDKIAQERREENRQNFLKN